MKEKIDLVKLWVKKAKSDLINAKHSIDIEPEAPLDAVCFHAQQCAEKYLKAFLAFQEIEFEKTHDLAGFTKLAMKIDSNFEQIMEYAKTLTPYAIEIRYPGIFDELITKNKAKEAIEMTIKIKEFVLERLPLNSEEK